MFHGINLLVVISLKGMGDEESYREREIEICPRGIYN